MSQQTSDRSSHSDWKDQPYSTKLLDVPVFLKLSPSTFSFVEQGSLTGAHFTQTPVLGTIRPLFIFISRAGIKKEVSSFKVRVSLHL